MQRYAVRYVKGRWQLVTGQEEYSELEKYIRMHSSKVRKCGNGIVFNCLYHNDSVPSASLKMGRNGYPLSYCSVCGSIYHQLKKDAGLWQDKAHSSEEYTPFEKFLYYNSEDEYKMYDFVTEKYLCSHFRMKDKEKQGFPRGVRDGEHVTKGTDRIDTTYAVFCNEHLKEVKNAIEKKNVVCYTEGEKDTKCLWNNGFISFTCGGTNTFKKDLLPYLKGGRFVVFGDNDKAGIADAERITALLNTVGTAKMIIPPEVPEKGDISDYMKSHTKEDLHKLIDVAFKKDTVKETVGEGVTEQDIFVTKPKQIDRMQFHIVAENGKITGVYHNAIFEYIKANYDLFVVGGTPYIYDCGYYKVDTTGARLKSIIREMIFPQFIKSTTINNIYTLFLQDISLEIQFEQLNDYPSYWICFQNGMYDTQAKELLPHNPKYRAINQIPHNFKPDSHYEGKKTEEYLDFICEEPDSREMLLQFIGYSLTKDVAQQKFLVLNGEGGSGKSTVIRLIEAITGSKNVSNISLTDLQQRFASFGLMGKLLNSCADLEISALEDTSIIKKILGEDTLRAEQKGRDAISFKSYAKLIFSTNELPLVKSEKTNGFFRRLLVLTMNKVPEKKNPNLYQELVQEIDYLLQLAVQAVERMYQQKIITVSKASEKAVLQLRADSDTVEAFLQEICSDNEKSRVERTELYKKYADFCEETGRQSLTKNNFYKSLRVKGYTEIKTGGYRYFKGISYLKDCSQDALNSAPCGFVNITQEQINELPFD